MSVNASTHRRVGRPVAVVALAVAVAAPLLWFTHLSVLYALAPWACRIGTDAPLHVATAVAVVGLVACTAAAHRLAPGRSLRNLRTRLLGLHPDHDRTVPALVALAMAAYFTFVAAMTGVVPLVVHRCA